MMIGGMVGTYKIAEMIGEGGMGAVYRGIDVMLEREVAIKMLRPELARQPNLVERFRSEAVTLARLNHPNIATLYSFLRQGDDFFMVMEYVRGETLDGYLRRAGAMPLQPAIRLFCQSLEGIDHAHQMGIVHRDIKPANMMLTTNGSIKVMDFGIARVLGTSRMTRTGHLIGTIEYMSPEQVKGEETDGRSDIYSLGMLLYEILTGRLPFNANSDFELMRSQIEEAPCPPTRFAPHIPLGVEQTIMRSLAKRADARFQTAGQFRAALQSAIAITVPIEGQLPPVYAAPVTRLDNSNTPVPGQTPSAPRASGGGAGAHAAPDPRFKETRVASNPATPPGYQQVPPGYQQTPPPGYQTPVPGQPQASVAYQQPPAGYPPNAVPGQQQPPPGYQQTPSQGSNATAQAGPQGTVVLNYGQGVAAYQGHQAGHQVAAITGNPGAPAAVRPVNSFLASLNWKHYTAAGIVIFVIISLPFFLFLDRSAGAPAQSPTQPAPAASPSQQPSGSDSNVPRLDPNARTAPIPPDNLQSNPSRSGNKPANARDTTATQPAQPAQPDGRASSSNTKDAAARSAEQPATGGDTRAANSAENKNKGTGAKIGGAVGGAVKKLGGIFGGKKKKEEPKP